MTRLSQWTLSRRQFLAAAATAAGSAALEPSIAGTAQGVLRTNWQRPIFRARADVVVEAREGRLPGGVLAFSGRNPQNVGI